MEKKIKQFFQKKKVEAKFKLAGPGHKLSEAGTSSKTSTESKNEVVVKRSGLTEESKVAAEAALSRLSLKRGNPSFNTSYAFIQAQVKKELEEASSSNAEEPQERESTPEKEVDPPNNLAVSGVYFKCPMLNEDILPRNEWRANIRKFLDEMKQHDLAGAGALILQTCNANREKIDLCVETLSKYIENLIAFPDEEKYHKIRMSNNAFRERVLCLEGSLDILHAAGYREHMLPFEDSETEFLVFNKENISSMDYLKTVLEQVRDAQVIPLELDRNLQVLLPSQAAGRVQLPSSFYAMSPEEIKKEQQLSNRSQNNISHLEANSSEDLHQNSSDEELQPSTSSPENTGQGGRQGGGVQWPLDPLGLLQIRAEKTLTKRRINAMPAEYRKELMNKKRKDELQRILLPDAPPRKRKRWDYSPEREVCPLIEPEPVPQPDYDILAMDVIVVGQDVEVETLPQPKKPKLKTCVNDNYDFETTVDNMLADDSDADLEIDLDDEACSISVSRNALTEPTCLTDLTELQTEVFQTEDYINDLALRDIMKNKENYHFDWKKDCANFTGRKETFTGTPGPTFDVTGKSIVDIFYKMIDTDFIDLLCTETNRYAEQKIHGLRSENKLTPSSRLHRWTPTDRDEMISFLALMILQGLYPLPEEEKYFSFNGFGTMPYFARVMSYNRFALIKSMYHFVDNQTLTERTKLCKIQPVLDYFNDKFSTLYIPSQDIAIDESLLKWHGRLSFAQKIATKAAQVGVKTYELCESRSGYLWKFFVYTGKKTALLDRLMGDETLDQSDDVTDDGTDDVTVERPDCETLDQSDDVTDDGTDDVTDDGTDDVTVERSYYETLDQPDDVTDDGTDDVTVEGPDCLTLYRLQNGETVIRPGSSLARPTNATAKIVLDLVEPLLDRGYTLIMDNFYNSPLLLRHLKKHKTDCYGTLRLNREFVPDSLKTLTMTDLRQGEVVASYCSDLSVMVWRDAKLVGMISTYHQLRVGVQNKHKRLTYKPKIVLDYNKSMGGVDRKDQFLSAHPMERLRNKVWYKKVFCRLFSSALFNAFIIFSSQNPKVTHREFRTILAEDLLKRHRQIDLTTEPRLYVSPNRQLTIRTYSRVLVDVDNDHFPVRSDISRKRCWMCRHRKKNSRTNWKCLQCDVSLCIEHCFRDYHKTQLK